MRKPWSISTTVRNPERLRGFLQVLKQLEGQNFNRENQIKYQISLIQAKLYEPTRLTPEQQEMFENPEAETIPYEIAKGIFNSSDYVDPAMRGRQSVNPLNKLGFAIARHEQGPIKITELGNKLISSEFDLSLIFFKSFLKLQFPNPWSRDFSYKQGFNIIPFISTFHLMRRIQGQSKLSRNEFCIFIPTLISYDKINEQIENIDNYRKASKKEDYLYEYAKRFYETDNVTKKMINNFFEYGDNIYRYFRLTKYFEISADPTGIYWNIGLSKSRLKEIEQLTELYDGKPAEFSSTEKYLEYLSDINKPELPWEKIDNLRLIAESIRNTIKVESESKRVPIFKKEKDHLEAVIIKYNEQELFSYINLLRSLNLKIKSRQKKAMLVGNLEKLLTIVNTLKNRKELRKYAPANFEKLIADAYQVINDEISIEPNYIKDDEGEPIGHAPGNQSDIECFYETFNSTCEVTLSAGRLQWIQEGQPVMRHLRQFENENPQKTAFCIFIAPVIHVDTLSTFWNAIKHGYDGRILRIIPLSTEIFAQILEYIIIIKKERVVDFKHSNLYEIYNLIISSIESFESFSDWNKEIPNVLESWFKGILN